MISTKEATNILKCDPAQITRYAKSGKLILLETMKREKFYSVESVEAIRAKKFPNGISIISKEKKEIKKNSQKEISESFSLNEIGTQIMADTIDELKSLGLYRENDKYAILDYAMFYQMAMLTTIDASKNTTYTDMKGVQRISADATLSLSYTRLLDEKRKRLGLDPAGRSKLTIKEKKDIDEMADLIYG